MTSPLGVEPHKGRQEMQKASASDGFFSYFGCCPQCGGISGQVFTSIREVWFYCAEHEVKWCGGGEMRTSFPDEVWRKVRDEIGFDDLRDIDVAAWNNQWHDAAVRRENGQINSARRWVRESTEISRARWQEVLDDEQMLNEEKVGRRSGAKRPSAGVTVVMRVRDAGATS
jgi:hypothetical protein